MPRTKRVKKLTELLAENMAIYAGQHDVGQFLPQAEELMRRFRAIEGRWPEDYLEIEDWSRNRLDKSGNLLVVK